MTTSWLYSTFMTRVSIIETLHVRYRHINYSSFYSEAKSAKWYNSYYLNPIIFIHHNLEPSAVTGNVTELYLAGRETTGILLFKIYSKFYRCGFMSCDNKLYHIRITQYELKDVC